MSSYKEKNSAYSEALHRALGLKTEPIAVKMIGNESEVPEGAIHPFRDQNRHLALCQAFALVRREKVTIYTDKTSEWCWAPLVAFGMCDSDEGTEAYNVITGVIGVREKDAAKRFFSNFPRLPLGKYIGVLLAPLRECSFEPDVTLVYCDDNSQLRGAVLAVKNATGKLIGTQLDAIDSCAYSCAATINSGEYRVTIPDIGEHERASAGESEIILSVPTGKLEELTGALTSLHDSGRGYAYWKRGMTYDFPRPPFYENLFELWGL